MDVPSNDYEPVTGLWRRLFVERAIGALLLVLMCMGGVFGYGAMAKEQSPDLEIPKANVLVRWPGADPETIEQQVTKDLEAEVKTLKHLKDVQSASFDSFAIVAVEFEADADLADAMARLRAAVSDAKAEFPDEVEEPEVNQVSVDDSPVLSVALVGDLDIGRMTQAAEDLQDALEQVPGVNEVELSGDRKQIVRVRLDPARLQALGLTNTQVRDAVARGSQDMPWGEFENTRGTSKVVFYARFREVFDIAVTPVARLDGGRVVRLYEVAEVQMDLEEETSRAALSWKGDAFQRTIDVSITKVPGSDAVRVIAAAKAATEKFASGESWPVGLEFRFTSDTSEDIWDSLRSAFDNIWQAMLAVFVILLLALSWREAVIAGLAIPVTFLGTLAALWMMGQTLNQLVIVGMVLALGLLVDVFILMMEGMHEHVVVRRMPFANAAVATVRTYGPPAFAGQLTTILALAPLMAIGGIPGKFIRVIPITAITCLVFSFTVALLVCVPLSGMLLRTPEGEEPPSTVDKLSATASERLGNWLRTWVLHDKGRAVAWVGAAFVSFIVAANLFGTLPSLLFPDEDQRNLGVTVELPPSANLDQASVCADGVGNYLASQPYLESVTKFTGKKSPLATANTADALTPSEAPYLVGFSLKFTPEEARDKLSFDYLPELRRGLSEALVSCPGGVAITYPPGSGSSSGDPVRLDLYGPDMEVLRLHAEQVKQVLATAPGALEVRDNLGRAQITVRAEPMREALDFYGLAVPDVASQVRLAMETDEVFKFPQGGDEEDLEVRFGTRWPTRGPDIGGPTRFWELGFMRVQTKDGTSVPLPQVVSFSPTPTAVSVPHRDGERTVAVMSKVAKGYTSSLILDDAVPKLDELAKTWPRGYGYKVTGEAEESAETFGSAGQALLVAVFMVFAVLTLQFNSFSQPFIIMLSVPLAFIGSFLAFYLLQVPISFPMFIGAISLVGIVVNNAIVMISAMNDLREEGMGVVDAAATGASSRLRPILSTTLTTLVGLVPLALSNPIWMPLCLTIIAGLIAGTVVSMIIVPSLYLLFSRG